MAAGRPRGHGASKSFGVGWLQDQLRARFDIRGPIGEPFDVAPDVQVGMEARPSLPWEYGNARWLPVAGHNQIGAGGAGTFSSVSISVPQAGTRALVLERISAGSQGAAGACALALYVNQAFVAGTVGFGLRDGRFTAGGVAGSWLTPVPDAASIAQNAAVALPPATDRVEVLVNTGFAVGTLPFISAPWILAPGQTIAVFETIGNTDLYVNATGFLVPLADIT